MQKHPLRFIQCEAQGSVFIYPDPWKFVFGDSSFSVVVRRDFFAKVPPDSLSADSEIQRGLGSEAHQLI